MDALGTLRVSEEHLELSGFQEWPIWEERAGKGVTSVYRCLLSTYSLPWSVNMSEQGPLTGLGISAGARS